MLEPTTKRAEIAVVLKLLDFVHQSQQHLLRDVVRVLRTDLVRVEPALNHRSVSRKHLIPRGFPAGLESFDQADTCRIQNMQPCWRAARSTMQALYLDQGDSALPWSPTILSIPQG